MSSLLLQSMELLREAKLEKFELLRHMYDEEHFGNGEVLYKIGQVIIRFLRDRSQDFICLASTKRPDNYYDFGIVEIAMGWKSVQDIISRKEPERLADIVNIISCRFKDIESAMTSKKMLLRFEKAEKEHGEAIFSKLKEQQSVENPIQRGSNANEKATLTSTSNSLKDKLVLKLLEGANLGDIKSISRLAGLTKTYLLSNEWNEALYQAIYKVERKPTQRNILEIKDDLIVFWKSRLRHERRL